MRIYDYLDEILRTLNAEESNGVPTPSWRIEEYLKDIYDAIRSGIYPSDEQVAEAIDAWLDDHPEATTTVEDGAITNAKLATSFVTPGVASAYSSSATYAVGDYCFYNGSLYRCITPITTAEAWTAAHWTAAVLGDDVGDLKSAIAYSNEGLLPYSTIAKKYINPSNGGYYTDATYTATDLIPCGDSTVKIISNEQSPFCAWYDANKDYVAALTIDAGVNVLAVPSGAAYFAVSMTTNNLANFKVYSYVGATLSKLVPITRATGNDITITSGKYIVHSNGGVGTQSTTGASDAMPVVGGTKYKFTLSSAWSSADLKGLAFYKDGAYISGVQYAANTISYVLTAPNNANELRATVKLSDASSGYFTIEAISNLIELTDYIGTMVNRNIPEVVPNVFAFQTVGIIGDSLASGASNYKDDQDVWHALDRKAFAWGKFLEKRQGCTVTLFSAGGMDTETWFTSPKGYSAAQASPCECYYIGLGVNDYASKGAAYLGTIADVNAGNEDLNANSFYGNYSKIIAKLTTIQPRCKIFCFTMPDSQSASQTRLDYDTAIRTVAALYDNAFLLDLSGDTFYTSEPITSTFYGAHYLATGYSMMADHILEITNKYMLAHLSDFADIQWITNNYPNSDASN